MEISNFDYLLPQELIAQSPAEPRDHSRLMVIDRKKETVTHKHFYNLTDYLTTNDVLVLNNTKVFPARFFAKKETGGKIEVLLIEESGVKTWKALSHPGLKNGQKIVFENNIFEAVGHEEETVLLQTALDKFELLSLLRDKGHTPLPPYIQSIEAERDLRQKYQTVYAKPEGSVAAPTAGFHFTKELMSKISGMGVQIEYVTLHVGLGTFAPVKSQNLKDHPMHFEYFELDRETAVKLNNAKASGKRIISVGTTTTRVLESSSSDKGVLTPQSSKTNLFIYPPYRFKFVDGLITNFHLPKSTLLTLVSAFVSSPNTEKEFSDFKSSLMGKAYSEAVKEKYRFYSFGDSSLIL
jgi:S-adenosylmethionine:tRNA ribosyltransferase-isomerase